MAPSRSRAHNLFYAVTLAAQVLTVDSTTTAVLGGNAATGGGIALESGLGNCYPNCQKTLSISQNWETTLYLYSSSTGTIGTGDKLKFAPSCDVAGSGAAADLGAAGTGADVDMTGGAHAKITMTSITTGLLLCYQASGSADSVSQTGISLDVIAPSPNNKFTAISPQSIYANAATAITLTGTALNGDKAIFATSCVAADWSLAAGAANAPVALTVGSTQASTFKMGTTGAGFRLCLRNVGGSDAIAQDNVFLSVSAVGGVGADPVTWFGDQVRVFSLPVNTLMPLMHSTDMKLHGQTFMYGGPWQQWFGRLVLATPNGERWIQLQIKKDILDFNRSKSIKGNFESMEVTLGHGSFDNPTYTSAVPSPNIQIPLNFLGFDVVFWQMKKNSRAANTMIGAAHRECMEVAGANVHFYVCSAPAHEFYGHQRDLSVQHAHLDLAIIEVKDGQELKGTLPELWGMQPMSAETEAYIQHDNSEKPQTSSKQIAQEAALSGAIPSDAPSRDVLVGLALPKLPEGSLPAGLGWAGGMGFKDLEKSCKQGNSTVLACENEDAKKETVTLSV